MKRSRTEDFFPNNNEFKYANIRSLELLTFRFPRYLVIMYIRLLSINPLLLMYTQQTKSTCYKQRVNSFMLAIVF